MQLRTFISFRSLPAGLSALTHANATAYRHASSSSSSSASAAVNYYRRLEVSTDATPAELKAAYRKMALQWHPDVVDSSRRGEAEARFRAAAEAYDVLSDPARRRQVDASLGIQTRRKQGPTASATAAPAAATTSGRPRGGSGPRRTTATNSGSGDRGSSWFKGSSSTSAGRRKKPFVRGDADRVFRDAFDGQSLEQVLFEFRRRQRQEAFKTAKREAAGAAKASPSSSSSPSSPHSLGAPHTREETLERVAGRAAENFARHAQRQFGHGILKHMRVGRMPGRGGHPAGEAPPPPPSDHMPFRPFANLPVPEGVTVPPMPTVGPLMDGREELPGYDACALAAGERRMGQGAVQPPQPVGFGREDPQHKCSATNDTRFDTLNEYQRSIQEGAYNMGQLYSYQRPY